MTKDEVLHLAHLARIAVDDREVTQLTEEIDAIIAYVSEVAEVAGADADAPAVGVVHNVFRDDVVTNQLNQYTDALIAAMPDTDGRFMRVKKILQQDD